MYFPIGYTWHILNEFTCYSLQSIIVCFYYVVCIYTSTIVLLYVLFDKCIDTSCIMLTVNHIHK
jgi:hypothetical protein